jgi:xylulokinase
VSLLAIDMGSSNCKAIAFSEDGTALAHATCSYSSNSPFPSWAEMEAETFWQAFQTVTRTIAAAVTQDPVESLAVSSHGETFVPVDSQGRTVASAILNVDNRSVGEANWLADKLGRRRFFEITGLAVHPMYPLPKILWLRGHKPSVFSSSARFLALPDYLLTRLGVPAYIDYSLASRFLAFDIRKQAWSEEILSACELTTEQFSEPVPAGTVAGTLPAKIALDLGLRSGTPVVVGGHDQPCGALGCGVVGPGRVAASFGTYECLVAASDTPAAIHRALPANLNSYCHVVPERYVTLAYFPAGIMIEWFLRLIYPAAELAVPASVREHCDALEKNAAPGPTGLCVTPHLLGTCNPDFDPCATGVIAGLRPGTSRSDIYKGILEGIACEFAMAIELLQPVTGASLELYAHGGGGRSRLGLKLRASLSNRPIHLLHCPEAVCLGTAILAGVAIGKYRNAADAVAQLVKAAETIVPDQAIAQSYKAQMEQYRVLYSSLAPLRRAQEICD